jgi:hypothetical protein
VAETLDRYFDKMIGHLSSELQSEVRQMYYQKKNVIVSPGLLSGPTQMFANWSMAFSDGKPVFSVYIDPWIQNSPLLLRLNLIHEIGVHVVQAAERVRQVGSDQFNAEKESGAFDQFTEMTATVAEREGMALISIDALAADIRANFGKPELSREVFSIYAARFVTDLKLMLMMMHRQSKLGDPSASERDVVEFLEAFRRN